jgi:hypothetical protein
VRGRCRAPHETRPSARSNPGIRVLRSNCSTAATRRGAATLTSNWSARFTGLRGAATRRRCSLLVVIALAGFGAAYVPATGSSAPSATTTLPKPDPYPTTTAQHRPQPPPPPPSARVPPPPAPPPPPPPPAASVVPPPPPPPPARSVKPPRPRVHRTRAHEPDPGKGLVTSPRRSVAKRPAPERDRPRLAAAAGAPVAARATRDELRLPAGLLFLLAGGFLFLLVTAAVAVVPERALPVRLADAVDGRGEQLLFVALCALGLCFVVAFLIAFVSS